MIDEKLMIKAQEIAGPETLRFLQMVDDSQFSLHSWLEAHALFAAWLGERGRPADFAKMLGYLSCCAKSVEGKCYPLDLKDITREMLDQHGFDGK